MTIPIVHCANPQMTTNAKAQTSSNIRPLQLSL
jgi:hypothetical protein